MFGSPDIHRAGTRRILACPYCHGLQAIPAQPVQLAIGCRESGVQVAIVPGPGLSARTCSRMRGLARAGPRPAAPAPGLVAGQPGLPSIRLWRCPVVGSRAETAPHRLAMEDRDER